MSKINELRRKATEAARKRDWPNAIKLYERVCEIDSNNASFRNELGDIHLKTGDVFEALGSFTTAADLYRAVGLHNNAVAVLKKILRHDKNHLDALWGLGELKEIQGLESDAQLHFIEFLSKSEAVDGETRKKFVNRCLLLLEKCGDDLQMLSRVEEIFEAWKLSEDHARVLIQKARLAHDEDQDELVEKYIGRAREVYAQLDSLDDYLELVELQTGVAPAPSQTVDPIVDESTDAVEEPILAEASKTVEPMEGMRTGEIDLGFDIEVGGTGGAGAPEPNTIQIDIPTGGIDAVTPPVTSDAVVPEAPAASKPTVAEDLPPEKAPAPEPTPDPDPEPVAATPDPQPATDQPPAGSVDLLDELLSDAEGFDFGRTDSEHLESIGSNLGDQLASQLADDDYAGHYNVGVVYMEMGMYDRAADSFGRSSKGPEQRLKGLEMQGSCLRHADKNDAALAVFLQGLSEMTEPDLHHLGLLYEAGICFEQLGQEEDARRAFEQAVAVDGSFRDVADRLEKLGATTR